LGKKALHLTQLGGSLRPLFLSLCEQDGLSVEWVESESLIRFCYTLLTDGNVTELVEEAEPVADETEKRLLEKFESLLYLTSNLLPKCLIISGTKAAGFSDDVIPTMVRNAKEKGARIILDVKGKDLIESLKYEPDIIKPNLDEFIDTYKTEPTKDLLMDIAIKNRCRIILTNGNKKILASDGDNYFETEIQPIKAVNSIGCGDAFTAGLAVALEDGAGFSAAINEGIRCGALNARLIKPGVIR
jgi:fructose-1-phosphate kinase PfkB-like protein